MSFKFKNVRSKYQSEMVNNVVKTAIMNAPRAQSRRQGTSIRGAFESLGGGGGTNHVVCVCVCVSGGGGDSGGHASMQSLSYVRCFIGFTFAFEIDHVQQGGRG